LYARDGVTQGIDMAQRFCEDVPPLGKDSLGVWLSDWPWNSMLGKERWPEAFVMDLCRGSLLAQLWAGREPLTRAEHQQLQTFLDLLRARPGCFAHPQFILGDPWQGEPYGYCCRDGDRAFIALHNCTWADALLPLEFAGDVYRWYPDPARLTGAAGKIALRPFEVVLLEIVPAGQAPTLNRRFKTAPMPATFAEPSRELKLNIVHTATKPLPSVERIQRPEGEAAPPPVRISHQRGLSVSGAIPASANGGTLFIAADRSRHGAVFQTGYPGKEMNLALQVDGRTARAKPVLQTYTYPSSWQGWRITVPPANESQRFAGTITVMLVPAVAVCCSAYFIPAAEGLL
jgi:hypothetical protein